MQVKIQFQGQVNFLGNKEKNARGNPKKCLYHSSRIQAPNEKKNIFPLSQFSVIHGIWKM
jgi:hypothetical protein